MTTRIDFGVCGVLLLVLVGTWASWEETSHHDAWLLEDPARIVADFVLHEKLHVSFRLHNTARAPLRIVGASAC